jgi:hypothetical protein
MNFLTTSAGSRCHVVSLGMTFQIRHNDRCAPNSVISPEDFLLT